MASMRSGEVSRLGPYRLHGVLGEGGMGVVHLGVDPSGRAVAVKVLRDHVAHAPESRSRLAREVSTLRRVDHPAIAPFLDADVDGDRPYVVTRYVPGEPLDAWVAEHGPLAGEALRAFAVRLLDALAAIHAAGVVHRDLKPGNVLMPEGAPVVIDFGIAHVADESRLTSTGLVMGTPAYLAPELLTDGAVSPATDVWGWAATTVFAATGRSPFGGGPTPAVLDRVTRGAADLRGLSARLVEVLRGALDPDPAGRPSPSVVRETLVDLQVADFEAVVGEVGGPGSAGVGDRTERVHVDGGGFADSRTELVDPGRAQGVAPVPTDAARTQVVSSSTGAPEGERRDPGFPVGPGRGPSSTALASPAGGSEPLADPHGEAAGTGRHQGRGGPFVGGWEQARARETAPPTVAHPVVDTRVMPVVPASPRPAAPHPGSPESGRPAGPPGAVRPVPGGGSPAVPLVQGGAYSGPPSSAFHPAGAVAAPYLQEPGGAMAGPMPPAAARVSRRAGTLAALGLLLVALTGYLTGLGIVVGLVWSTLARLVDRVTTALAVRRMERGPRDRDAAVAVLTSPFHLLGAVLSGVVTSLLPILVALAFVAGLRALATSGQGGPSWASSIMIGAAAAGVVAWWGPGGGSLRRGSRTIVRTVLPGRVAAIAAVSASLVAAAVMFLVTQSSGWSVEWWPLDGVATWVASLLP